MSQRIELCECGQPKNSIRHSNAAANTVDAHAFKPAQTREGGEPQSLWPKDLTICSKCKRDMLTNRHAVDIWGQVVCLPNISWREACETERLRATGQPEPLRPGQAEVCAECGELSDSPKHIRYGSDLGNPVKHQFEPKNGGQPEKPREAALERFDYRGFATKALHVPQFEHHWIPEHYRASLDHVTEVMREVVRAALAAAP
jgi:hypothetical protein